MYVKEPLSWKTLGDGITEKCKCKGVRWEERTWKREWNTPRQAGRQAGTERVRTWHNTLTLRGPLVGLIRSIAPDPAVYPPPPPPFRVRHTARAERRVNLNCAAQKASFVVVVFSYALLCHKLSWTGHLVYSVYPDNSPYLDGMEWE